ncbi:hypothetical protein WJ973_22145 [Achromobacter xylosoxidans]
MRAALTQLSGELASGDGDRLYERVAAERASLLDARNGRPKGVYKDAEDALAAAQAERDQCAQAKAQLDADVDRLAALRAEHARAEAGQPWKDLEARAAEARARLAAVAKEREAFEGLQREQRQAAQTLAVLQEQVRRDQQDETELQALVAQAQAARAAVQEAQEPLARARRLRDTHVAAAEQARQRVAAVQAVADRRDLQQQLDQLARDIERLDGALEEATRLIEQGSTLKAEAVRIEIADADIQALRKSERALGDLQLRQQAIATRLSYAFDAGREAWLDGAALAGNGELLLTAAAELELPGLGRLRIEPGGQDLPALKRELAQMQAASAALLSRLGVAHAAEAEERHARGIALQRELDAMRKTLAIHAPKGVDALRGQRNEAQARRAQLAERLALLPPRQRPTTSIRRPRARRCAMPKPAPRKPSRPWRRSSAPWMPTAPAPNCSKPRPPRAAPTCNRPNARRSARIVPAAWPRPATATTCSNNACIRRRPHWKRCAPNCWSRTRNATRNPPPSNATPSTGATARSSNCWASWSRPARKPGRTIVRSRGRLRTPAAPPR